MVECESWTPPLLLSNTNVLIDTWWNVNYIQQSKILNPNKVLIDTWWNVNQSTSTKEFVSVAGFNRYMVECESLDSQLQILAINVLIDTWWNVNLYSAIKDS